MHIELVKEYVKQVRARVKEGDNPTTPPLDTETLEQVVDALAAELERARG